MLTKENGWVITSAFVTIEFSKLTAFHAESIALNQEWCFSVPLFEEGPCFLTECNLGKREIACGCTDRLLNRC